jgi:hypothetical protein
LTCSVVRPRKRSWSAVEHAVMSCPRMASAVRLKWRVTVAPPSAFRAVRRARWASIAEWRSIVTPSGDIGRGPLSRAQLHACFSLRSRQTLALWVIAIWALARFMLAASQLACGEWPNGCTADDRDELAPSHSITSSARPSDDGGTSRPSAVAVLRLIASSYLVGACTGKSAGFLALKDAIDVRRCSPKHITLIAAVRSRAPLAKCPLQ